MRPHAESVSIGNTGPGVLRRISEAAKLAAFDPGKLSPEARQSWERLGHDFKAGMTSTSAIPSCAAALLPLIGGWYRRPAAAMCCGSAAGCWCEGRA